MISFGPLRLRSQLFLSPRAGYTNLPFPLVARELGGLGLATTDLVNARSLIERNRKALMPIETSERDRPLAVPEEMRAAALWLESLGVSSVAWPKPAADVFETFAPTAFCGLKIRAPAECNSAPRGRCQVAPLQ